jgi:hypothetical protein
LSLTGSTTDGEVDATIGAGSASVVTVPGHIDLAGDINVAGELQTANIGYTDGDNAITIADGGGVTFAQDAYVANGSGLVVGNTSQITSSGYVPELQVQGTGDADSSMSIGRWSADEGGPALHFVKSRNATIGSNTVVQDDDLVGQLRFMADDGTDYAHHVATIRVEVDGTPGGNDLPGRITFNTTADGASGGTERMRIDSSGNVGIGATTVDEMLHLESSSAAAPNMKIQSTATNGYPAIKFQNDAATNTIWGANGGGANSDAFEVEMGGGGLFSLSPSGMALINTRANGNMTQGLTIDQAANDNEIFSLKSSDVAHGATNYTETDTYFYASKRSAAQGGVRLFGFTDGAGMAVDLHGLAPTPDTSDTSTSNAVVRIGAYKTDGSSAQQVADGENMLCVHNADAVCRLVLKGNGTMHITNTTLSGLDEENDIGLVRAFQKASSKGVGLVMSRWDEVMKENEEDLRRVGVLSSQSDFVIQQNFNSLIGGSVWQLYTKLQETKEFYEDKIAALEQRLLRLEA